MDRRTFLQIPAAMAASQTLASAAGARLPIKRAVEFSMLPKEASILERFKIAKGAGFEQIECPTSDAKDADEMQAAAAQTGLRIHSVMNMDHWRYPLSSPDPEVVAKSLKGIETSLRNARQWGADTVLIVPAVVNPGVSYAQAYERSQVQIRKVLPLAEELKVIIGVEEVWNKFLLSPVEFAKYIDDFHSPWVRAYFDVGNVALYGYPQDWIRTLGKRIVKLHIKDFYFRKQEAKWVPLGEGDIDWKAIYQALADVGYQGSATVELASGDAAYLTEVNRRFERILRGESPL